MLTPDFPPESGGIQILVHRVVSGFTRLRARVVAINDEGASDWDVGSAVDTIRAGSPRLPNRANVAALNAAGVRAGLAFRPHVVLSAHIVCAPAATTLRRTLGVPYVQYLHADEIPATPGIAAFAMRRAERIVAVSRHTRQIAIDAGGDPDRIEIINPGVDLPQRRPAQRLERPTVLTVATLKKRYKGHDVMLRAMPLIRAQVPDAQWVVVGSGHFEALYREMAADRGLDGAVQFRGNVTSEERDEWLDGAHVFAMPSRLRPGGGGGEGFGIVYLEANAHGLPCVGGNVAGALDAVVDGETGLLVDPRDHVAVADAIGGLLLDRERAERMGSAGAERAAEYSWPKVSSRVEDLLLDAIGKA